MALIWKHPFTCIVAGPTGCGKTMFMKRFVENALDVVNPPPLRIIWCYGIFQDIFRDIKGVEFNEGLPEESMQRKGTLIIIDDLMHEADDSVSKIFTKYSHHRDVSVIFLTQNIFYKGGRTIGLNAHYLVLFKNPRDATQITYLARQMYPSKSKFMIEAFKDATTAPFSYLTVDLKANTDEKLRLRSGIFPGETSYVYLPK
jgi:hypothetical protein